MICQGSKAHLLLPVLVLMMATRLARVPALLLSRLGWLVNAAARRVALHGCRGLLGY